MFSVCFVCTGNRCRSPVAAGLLEQLTSGLDVEVVSAGTLSGGYASPPETIEAAAERGIDLGAHSSRSVSDSDLSSCNLVLGFEFDHVAAAVVDGGARRDVTFGLTEIVDLVENVEPVDVPDPETRARAVVAAAHELRGRDLPRIRPVPDPYGYPLPHHRKMVADVSDLCARLARALFGI